MNSQIKNNAVYWGTGRRKTSVARVRLIPGNGQIKINGRSGDDYLNFTPHLDTGDFVIVVNAEKVEVTGKKASQKLYRRHSGRPGGMKIEKFESLQERIPERIIEQAVKGMVPHNSLGRQQFKKLKVYKGAEHPHAAQNPVLLNN